MLSQLQFAAEAGEHHKQYEAANYLHQGLQSQGEHFNDTANALTLQELKG